MTAAGTFIYSGEDKLTDVQKSVIKDSLKKVQETSKSISSQHKELHGTVSRIGKAIDKVRQSYKTHG